MPDPQDPQPLDLALAELRQLMTDALFVINTIMELQRSTERLLGMLPPELRQIQGSIDALLSLLPSDEEGPDHA